MIKDEENKNLKQLLNSWVSWGIFPNVEIAGSYYKLKML